MSSDEYDHFEKLFDGRAWKYDHGENMEAFMDAAEMTDALKEVGRLPEVVSWTRDGNNIKFHTEANNNSFDITYVLDGTIEWKDVPSSQYRVASSFKSGILTQDATPLLDGKRYVYTTKIEGDELIQELMVPDVPGVTARRFYTKVPA